MGFGPIRALRVLFILYKLIKHLHRSNYHAEFSEYIKFHKNPNLTNFYRVMNARGQALSPCLHFFEKMSSASHIFKNFQEILRNFRILTKFGMINWFVSMKKKENKKKDPFRWQIEISVEESLDISLLVMVLRISGSKCNRSSDNKGNVPKQV